MMPGEKQRVELPNSERRVTVEELLRFKRAERPGEEFWAGFERQLKQRQLAAAIRARRSWWESALAVLPRFAVAIPAGAAAAFVAGYFAWNDGARQEAGANEFAVYSLQSTVGVGAPGAGATAGEQGTEDGRQNVAGVAGMAGVAAEAGAPGRQSAELAAAQAISDERVQAAREVFAAGAGREFAVRGSQFAVRGSQFTVGAGAQGRRAAGARNISAPALLAAPVAGGDSQAIAGVTQAAPVTVAEAGLAESAGNDSREATGSTGATGAVEETIVMKSDAVAVNDPRLGRLFSGINTAAAPAAVANGNPRVALVRERTTSKLNNKVLTDSASRFGATGESVSIKF